MTLTTSEIAADTSAYVADLYPDLFNLMPWFYFGLMVFAFGSILICLIWGKRRYMIHRRTHTVWRIVTTALMAAVCISSGKYEGHAGAVASDVSEDDKRPILVLVAVLVILSAPIFLPSNLANNLVSGTANLSNDHISYLDSYTSDTSSADDVEWAEGFQDAGEVLYYANGRFLKHEDALNWLIGEERPLLQVMREGLVNGVIPPYETASKYAQLHNDDRAKAISEEPRLYLFRKTLDSAVSLLG